MKPRTYQERMERPRPETKTIDITPTWSEVLPLILMVLENGKADGVKTAIEELNRMAECADRWNNHVKELNK